MLPKSLAGDVLIKIAEKVEVTNDVNSRKAEIVIIEDNQLMADSLAGLLKKCGKKTDVYYDGHIFLENFALIPYKGRF